MPPGNTGSLGDVILEFGEDGQLTYIVRGQAADQVSYLRYKVEGDTVITDQPSAPKVERTKFWISEDAVFGRSNSTELPTTFCVAKTDKVSNASAVLGDAARPYRDGRLSWKYAGPPIIGIMPVP